MSDDELIEAVKSGDTRKVETLIQAGADPNSHDGEQEWTPLNHASGMGDLEMVRLLVERGADVFNIGRDRRTPYKIALAARHAEVARYLKEAEERAGGDKDGISSRAWEKRPYCRAYRLRDLRRFPDWSQISINKEKKDRDDDAGAREEKEFSDDDVVFIHQDYTVTRSLTHDEHVVFDDVTTSWKEFCSAELKFEIPTDFDLIPTQADGNERTSG